MGMMDRFLGVGGTAAAVANAATGMAEILRENATRRMELDQATQSEATAQFAAEFAARPRNWFDSFVDGLNRLPRPVLTLGTVGLFVYAMIEPEGFGLRMTNLDLVPEPLWWLLGAIISFYFGSREAYHFRNRPRVGGGTPAPAPLQSAPTEDFADNAALRDWARAARADPAQGQVGLAEERRSDLEICLHPGPGWASHRYIAGHEAFSGVVMKGTTVARRHG